MLEGEIHEKINAVKLFSIYVYDKLKWNTNVKTILLKCSYFANEMDS